jgi:hypothetical protein
MVTGPLVQCRLTVSVLRMSFCCAVHRDSSMIYVVFFFSRKYCSVTVHLGCCAGAQRDVPRFKKLGRLDGTYDVSIGEWVF